MAKITYNKLVRDRILEIVQADGKQCETIVMGEDEYRQALRDKLVEEAQEAHKAELADVLEVIDSLMEAHGISVEAVRNMQMVRRQERGGFEKRLKLIWSGKDD